MFAVLNSLCNYIDRSIKPTVGSKVLWSMGRIQTPDFSLPKPGPKSFRVWRRLLATTFLRGHRARVSATTRNLTLRRGTSRWRWLPSSYAFRYQWQSFYLAPLDTLFLLSDDAVTFTLHPAKQIRRRPKHPVRASTLESVGTTKSLPTEAVPVDAY
jgi:hypothetical protein